MRLTHERGIPVVVSAGNENISSEGVVPASWDNAVTVGAINMNYEKPEWSNFGKGIDIFAPGEAVDCAHSFGTKSYRARDGTSFAAPLVAGVMAHLLDVEGPRNADELWQRMKKLSTKGRVKNTMKSPNRLLFNGVTD